LAPLLALPTTVTLLKKTWPFALEKQPFGSLGLAIWDLKSSPATAAAVVHAGADSTGTEPAWQRMVLT
jgi:ABC-type phosphate transport system permease subunit